MERGIGSTRSSLDPDLSADRLEEHCQLLGSPVPHVLVGIAHA